jgi:hypothetical protein
MYYYGCKKTEGTISETYALDEDYDKVVSKGKKIHRYDEMFYIYKVGQSYATVSVMDYNLNKEGYDKESSIETIFDEWVEDQHCWKNECTEITEEEAEELGIEDEY